MLCLTCEGTVLNNTFDGNIYVPLKTILTMNTLKTTGSVDNTPLHQGLDIFVGMTSGTN